MHFLETRDRTERADACRRVVDPMYAPPAGAARAFSGRTRSARRVVRIRSGQVRAIKKGMSEQSLTLTDRAARIRLLLMDCDGVLTDGTVFFLPAPDGSVAETKGFDCHDGIALQWARRANIETGIITGRGGLAVRERARSSRMRYLVEGAHRQAQLLHGDTRRFRPHR